MGQFFNEILIRPIVNILLLFNFIFSSVNLPFAFGFAIIALTVFIRLVLHPLFHKQLLMAKKMEKLKPHLDQLTKKYKDDKKRLQEEQLKLYKEMGVNPALGCMSLIIQIPIFIALYNVLSKFLLNGGSMKIIDSINKTIYFPFLKIGILDPNFFGFNLSSSPSQFQKIGIHYLAIPIITGALQYFQAKLSTPRPAALEERDKTSEKDKEKNDQGDMQKAMATQMKVVFPLMIGYFSFSLPVGLSLYWNIFSIFSIIQYSKKIDI